MADKEFKLSVPVMMIIFNRPDTTKEVFEGIRRAKPPKFYIVSDAPREGREDDVEKVKACREYVESHIDWPCEVIKDYAETNMGCKMRMASGITNVLSKEPYTIILEDDVVPVPEFFRYCEEMLKLYENDERVMMISGTNLIRDHKIDAPYTFSCFSSIWGWATWARAWKDYDVDVKDWPELKKKGTLKTVQGDGFAYMFLTKHIDSVYTHEKDTWDIQWDYCRHTHHGLGIVPRENLIRNIGFDREDATHTTWHTEEDFSYGTVEFPLKKILPIKRDVEYDRAYIKKYYGVKKFAEALAKRFKIFK